MPITRRMLHAGISPGVLWIDGVTGPGFNVQPSGAGGHLSRL